MISFSVYIFVWKYFLYSNVSLDYFVAVNQTEEENAVLEDDEAEKELQLALERSRRRKTKKLNENSESNLVERVKFILVCHNMFLDLSLLCTET